MNTAMPLGYRIVGPCSRERKVVQYDRAFAAYAACDDLAQIDSEGFLSPFQYDNEILTRRIDTAGTLDVRGFDGGCWSRFIWFDIDREGDIDSATQDARRLAMMLVERYRIDESDLLLFFSGSKGFHIGLPTSLFGAEPSIEFGSIVRKLAEGLTASVRVVIDPSVYGKVQPLRAPNSRHGKTGRHKRILTFDELMHRKPSSIVTASAEPLEFDLPTEPDIDQRAVDDWHAAVAAMKRKAEAVKVIAADRSELNRSTLEFIQDGADQGDRHRLLYSAAANLAEFGCPTRLAHALLTEAALDSGLTPTDVRRAIDNALSKGGAA
ncbi:DNA primase small subunit domain-containing protein [Rhodopirellula sp. P2]|uniref:DNA primase small subunit domain-containing protein n=1 Tax=Rhodopirellula sp. P2 TaxID=2127060 RepID=UPI002367EB41|nr:DNA primase small subunit domain-containing protein [Rhodopirellula sp. P2]WDQ16798.1 DNA primase [Rhodopirellula sp. P2]